MCNCVVLYVRCAKLTEKIRLTNDKVKKKIQTDISYKIKITFFLRCIESFF